MSEQPSPMLMRGALPPVSAHPWPNLRNVLTSELPQPTAPFDYGSGINFPMALNGGAPEPKLGGPYGDCTIAGIVHLAQIQAKAVGVDYKYPGDAAVLSAYCQLSGCTVDEMINEQSAHDHGLQLSQVVSAAATGDGLLGYKVAGAVTVDIRDYALMRAALYSLGALYLAIDLPQVAEQDFAQGRAWDVSQWMSQPVGGHCVVASGDSYLPYLRVSQHASNPFDIETWAQETELTWPFWRYYGVECWALIPQWYVDAEHDALQHIDVASMNDILQSLHAEDE
jgi:hypothetical protein